MPRHERLVVTYILPGIRHNPPYPTHFFGGRRRLTQASSPDNVPHNAPLSTPLEPESLPICICWDHSSVFSQWYPSTFTADIEHYNCAEQYMMLEKVKCFVDTATRLKIMSSPNSAQPKRLGRSVSNFNQGIWVQHRYDIVLKGNLAKFSAPPILQQFVDTGDNFLAETSPYDFVWGIGLGCDVCEPFNLRTGRDSKGWATSS